MPYEYTPEEEEALSRAWSRDWAAVAALSQPMIPGTGFSLGMRAVGFNPSLGRYYDPTGYEQGTYDPRAGQYFDLAGAVTTPQAIVSASEALQRSKLPSSPLEISPSPTTTEVTDAAENVAGASQPTVPQFITPYVKPSGFGAYGERDIFAPSKKLY